MKSINNLIAATFALFLVASQAHAQQVALPLKIQDGLENMWEVSKKGTLNGPAPFNGGAAFSLNIDEIDFPDLNSATRTVTENGTELLIGPKVVGSVHVTRKLFFGKGEGYIRALEILENRSTTPVTVKIQTGSYAKDEEDLIWISENAAICADGSYSGVEVYYGKGGLSIPKQSKAKGDRDDIVLFWDGLSIQPESKIVLLHFIGVRPKREQALEFAQSFEVAPACVDIDPGDLASIINFDPRTLGAKAGIEIFRGGEKEALLLKSGDKLTGTVQNENFRIQTSYAQLEFPANDIATIIYEGGANNIERIVVLNGDVFSGFILDAEVTVKLDAGPVIKIRKEKISKLGFRVRANEKEKYPVNHDVTLTNGDHFSGTVKNQSLKIGAAFGEMPVEIGQIAKIEFISKKGTVTEITLKNGDKVSGFLKDEDIAIDLDFGREVSIYQDRIEKIIFDKKLLEQLSGEALKKAEDAKSK